MLKLLAGRQDHQSFHRLPELIELANSQALQQEQRREAKQHFCNVAKAKIKALQRLSAFAKSRGRCSPQEQSPLIKDLLCLSGGFNGNRLGNVGGWPQHVWDIARKWPDYFKHDHLWSLVDAINLFASPENAWTSHVLCLSNLTCAKLAYKAFKSHLALRVPLAAILRCRGECAGQAFS